jgi:hypothetical protein
VGVNVLGRGSEIARGTEIEEGATDSPPQADILKATAIKMAAVSEFTFMFTPRLLTMVKRRHRRHE